MNLQGLKIGSVLHVWITTKACSSFNRQVKRFPGKVVASIFGFEEKEYFEVDEAAKEVPKVDFGDDGE